MVKENRAMALPNFKFGDKLLKERMLGENTLLSDIKDLESRKRNRPFRLEEITKLQDWAGLDKQQRGAMAFNLIKEMKESAKHIEMRWLYLGCLWKFIKDNKVYKSVGDHVTNQNEFLREIDLGVQKSMLDHYSRLWAQFGAVLLKLGGDLPPIRKILLISPVVSVDSSDEVKEEWLTKAANLPYEALQNEVREERGQVTTDSCDHPPESQESWVRCNKCSKWIKG